MNKQGIHFNKIETKKAGIAILKEYYKKKNRKKLLFHLALIGLGCTLVAITREWWLLSILFFFGTITIVLDSATTFDNTETKYNAIARLSDTKFVIAFVDVGDSNKGKVIIGTRSGTTVTIVADSAITFEDGQTKNVSVCAMSETHFVVAYMDDSDGNKGKMLACSVSGTTITLGSIVEFSDNIWDQMTVLKPFNDTYFILLYEPGSGEINSGDLCSRVCLLSGTTITQGNEENNIVNNVEGRYDLTTLTSTKIVVVYKYGQYGYSKVGTVNTGAKTISFGSEFQALGRGPTHISLSTLSERYFLVVSSLNSISGKYGQAKIGDVEGTNISYGLAKSFATTSGLGYSDSCKMDSAHFVICFQDWNNSNKGTVLGGSVVGTTITWDAEGEIVFESGNTTYLSICRMTSSYFAISFKDNG